MARSRCLDEDDEVTGAVAEESAIVEEMGVRRSLFDNTVLSSSRAGRKGSSKSTTTTSIRCSRCHSTTFEVSDYQGRSCDEGMSLKYTCSNCSHKWKLT